MPLSLGFLNLAAQMIPDDEDPMEDVRTRRAISTAYYAVFHLVAESVGRQAVGEGLDDLKARVQRTLTHRDLRDVSVSLSNGQVPKMLTGILVTVPDDVRDFSRRLVELQQSRNFADYNISLSHSSYMAVNAVVSANAAFNLWATIETDTKKAIVIAFLTSRQFKS